MENHPDPDPQETQEWIESLEAVIEREGTGRAHSLLEKLVEKARRSGVYLPYSANTAYLREPQIPRFTRDDTPFCHSEQSRGSAVPAPLCGMFRARFAKSQLFTSILIRFGIPAP